MVTPTPPPAAPARTFQLKRRPKQPRACATFDAIVEAAARILASEGYAAMTTDRLATVAGVGVGSVYEYFASKEAIVAELVRRIVDELVRELGAGAVTTLTSGPEAWLRGWVHAMFAAVDARRALLRALFHEVPFLGEIDAVRELPGRLLALATNSPREVTELPYVTSASIFLLTTMVRSAVLESVLDPPPGVATDELEATLAQILLGLLAQGLRAR